MGKYLKKKLSLIKEIPAGYKQTEIGVFPEDWEVDKLSNVAPLQRGFDLPMSQIKKGPFPVVYSNGILNFHHKAMAKAPGVVTGRSGTIGKVNYIEKDYWPHNTTLWVTSFKGNDEKYVYFLYSHIQIERFRTGSGVPTLNRNDVHDFQVSIPKSKSEQIAIATILSDADALIECLEKLIAKKKAIKQGAMQQLLTGKKRLPGFGGKWEVKELGELVDYRNGKSFESHVGDYGDYFLITLNSLDITGKLKDNHLRVSFIDKSLNKNDLIMILSDVAHGNFLGLTDVIPEDNKYVLNQRVGALKNIRRLTPYYLSKYINLNQKYFKTAGQGSSQQNLSKDDILNFKVLFPPTQSEQTAIATILSDMDTEIENLEQKRDKYIMLKQGMMQQLLTGRIRIYANN